ncbi:MAG: type II secretion system protein GspM [Pseudomonadota bacterium]
MNIEQSLGRKPTSTLLAAGGGYAALVIVLAYLTCSSIADIFERRAALAASNEILAQLEERRPQSPNAAGTADGPPSGSPFLEGPTVTVAGAALLQRVTGAVNRVGGNVLSSQVEFQGAQSKAGFVGVTVTCDVQQPALQQLLYDIEAGMPYLFVDQFTAQVSESSTETQGRMHVVLTVSGQWQGER